MLRSWFRKPLAFAVLVGLSTAALGAVQSRISGKISSTSGFTTIPGSVHAKVKQAADLGPAAGTMKLQGMTLRFSPTAAQQAALDQLLANQQNPSSPQYHQWLTPAQYAAQFGLSSADLAKVTGWLTSQGFTIDEVANSGTFVRFSGTVAQVDAAFATSIHNLSLNGVQHFGNVTDASVPAPLGSVVDGITGLHDFKLRARIRSRTVKASALKTQFTSSISGDHYIAPGDFYTIYNEIPALQKAVTGAGVTIAVMGQIDISATDVAAFRMASGLVPQISVGKANCAGAAGSVGTVGCFYVQDPGTGYSCSSSTNPNCPTPNLDDLQESSLDVEWAGATAPGATIVFVSSPDVIGDSLTDAIDNNIAPIMSVSYGDCESSWGTSELNTLNQLFKQAASQGITVVGPGGDDGATDCDYNSTVATQGLAVDFPASSPYVTGMGGTAFNEGTSTGATTYWAGSDTTITAAPAVTGATTSALSYIPEAAWNEDTSGAYFSAGGGGASNFFSKPAWQVGTPADASRDVPDLSLNSAAGHDGYLYCVSSSCVNGTFRASDGQSLTVGGGTSFATPTFAGILALVEQQTGSRIGNANPTIYALANNSAYYNNTSASVFHDVTTGNNDSPCTAGTPNCPNGGSIGYSAVAGYDQATGWGSVNVYNLVNAWAAVTPLSVGTTGLNVSNTTVSASPSAVTAGATVTFTATVSGAAGTPTGTVQFLINNVTVGTPVTLAAGAATYTYTTSCSNLGNFVVAASYSGDTTYAGSKGAGITAAGSSTVTPVQVTVSSGSCPDFSLSATKPAVTVTSGTPAATLTVQSINGFVGTVTFTASSTETSNTVPTLLFTPAAVNLSSGATATTTLSLANITAEFKRPAGLAPPPRGMPWYGPSGGIAVASLLLIFMPRRRRLGTLVAVVLGCGVALGTSGCSSGNGVITGTTSTNTQVGTYDVTVTANYSSGTQVTSHSTTVVFTVQ